MSAVVEGYKKNRVAFFKINHWINDWICNVNFIFQSDLACFFVNPGMKAG
jgi:hypothetical protein